jgi:hypothetical protein
VFRQINAGGLEDHIPVFPEPRGWLPFGTTENGDIMAWETGPSVARWNLIVMPAGDITRERFYMPMTEFLARLYSRGVVCDSFPDDLLELSLTFEPRPAAPYF